MGIGVRKGIFGTSLKTKQNIQGHPLKEFVDKNRVGKVRESREAKFSVSVDLGVKKEKLERKHKNQHSLRMKKLLLRQRKKNERLQRKKKAKAVRKLGAMVYKDVMPVVGALAVSSGEMLNEKVIPAMKHLGLETSARAGRVGSNTMEALKQFAPLVRDTIRSSVDQMMVGMKKAGAGMSVAAKEFQAKYSTTLAKIRAKQEKDKHSSRRTLGHRQPGTRATMKITPR